jgi:zinc protease
VTMRYTVRIFFIIAVVIVGLDLPLSAQKPAVLPDLSFKRLLNDLQITVASSRYLGDSMTIGLVVRYGAAFDPADKGGLAYLVSQMFLRATLEKTAKGLQEELDSLGATIEVRCDWDGIRFLLHSQSAKFERSLLILYEVVGEAQFLPADFAAVKAEILKQIQPPADPRLKIRGRLETILYQGTTYGRPLSGTAASVQNISIGDVRLFYSRYFSPSVASLVVAGSAPQDQIMQKAARIWGVWVRKDEVPFSFLPAVTPAGRQIYIEDDPASPAAQFILGNLWPRREEPAFYPASLAARILQERLTKALPTSLLTVHAEGRRMAGPIYIQGQAAADQVGDEIQKILDVLESFKEAEVIPSELAEAQKRWIEEFNVDQSTTAGICTSILDSELYRLGTNYSATFPEVVRRNGPAEIMVAAKEWIFSGGAVVVIRGPVASLKPALEHFGTIQSISP